MQGEVAGFRWLWRRVGIRRNVVEDTTASRSQTGRRCGSQVPELLGDDCFGYRLGGLRLHQNFDVRRYFAMQLDCDGVVSHTLQRF